MANDGGMSILKTKSVETKILPESDLQSHSTVSRTTRPGGWNTLKQEAHYQNDTVGLPAEPTSQAKHAQP